MTTPDQSRFLARLAELTPDISGTARIDISDFHPSTWKELRRLAEAHGWTYRGPERDLGKTQFVLSRQGSATVPRNDYYFLKGPGLEELRRYSAAHEAAAEAERRFGVNALSQKAFNDAASRYRADSKSCNRWAALATLPGLLLLAVASLTGRQLADGGTTAIVLIGLWSLLALATVVGSIGLTRRHRARKAALAPYKQAYEHVVQAVFRSGQ
ncbi:hypothetical protein ACFS2C_24705 [Prauserella oleivorans]|uniref:Uncharacterized protein n=1 Tax=Prauserella oleivorans TaxID=1478153 RepID=A0ABW5WF29_9PSEU